MYKIEVQLDFLNIFKLSLGECMQVINNEYDDFKPWWASAIALL
jgi:hypothetical protein